MKRLTKLAALALSFTMLSSNMVFAADTETKAADADTQTVAEETAAEEKTEEAAAEEKTEEEAVTEEKAEEEAVEEAAVSPFEDVDITTQTGKNILKLYNAGILAGYNENGKLVFKPEGNITRAELSRIFNGVFKYAPSEEQLSNVKNFADNEDPAAWYYNDVRIAQVAGYINGFEDNTFRAKENFTRQQACVVIDLITGVNNYDNNLVITDEVSEWADKYVNWAVTAGLFPLEENNTFRATQNITRAEVCNLLEIFVDETEAETTEDETTDKEVSTEATTQEVTVKTSNGTVVKVTRGGSGGGSSSSSSSSSGNSGSSTKTETTTVTEATTESTTSSESTTKASSGGSSSSVKPSNNSETKTTTTTVETTTEATTKDVPAPQTVTDPDPDVLKSIDSVYLSLIKSVIPNCSTSAEKSVATKISNALARYSNNHSYDIASAADEAIAEYRSLSDAERKELRNLIVQYTNVNDLLLLQQTYFPGLL